MEIVSHASHDVLEAGGNVRLGGALRIVSSGPLEIGDSFRLIKAGGKIRGNFDSILLAPGGSTRANFVTGGGNGILLIAPSSYTQLARPARSISMSAESRWTASAAASAGAPHISKHSAAASL